MSQVRCSSQAGCTLMRSGCRKAGVHPTQHLWHKGIIKITVHFEEVSHSLKNEIFRGAGVGDVDDSEMASLSERLMMVSPVP